MRKSIGRFVGELRRRSVLKVAAAYLVVAWLALQVADVMFPALGLPQWTITLVVALLVVGLPVALLLAWAFELTPHGLEREQSPAAAGGPAQIGPAPSAAGEAPSAGGASVAARRAVAVLPFADISPGRDQEYFADGLTEELLNALTRIPGLRVPSRTSCFAFKGRSVEIPAVAERLRATHVLEGSVRRSGDHLRITAQFIEASSDSRLWSDTYDRRFEDIFAIQDDIAHRIVRALELRLGPQDPAAPTTRDPRAYDLYLKGLSFYHRLGLKSLHFAIDMFRRATGLDPQFARAWAGLSNAHAALAIYHAGGDAERRASDEASRKAVELAPELAEAHVARAVSLLARERYDDAAVEFERAVQLNPGSFDAWYHYARTAVHQGKMHRALELFERAAAVDPEDYQVPLLAAPIHRSLGDEAKARQAERRGITLAERHLQDYPDNARAYFLSAAALYNLGEREKATAWAEKAVAIDPQDSSMRYNIACFYAQAGDAERALDFLEGSIASRSWAENDPELDPIRQHPRFRAFIASLPD